MPNKLINSDNIWEIITFVAGSVLAFFSGKKLSNANADKALTETEIARKNFEKQEKKEYIEDAIHYKKAFDSLEDEVEKMKVSFAGQIQFFKSEIDRLRSELEIMTRKYNIERTFKTVLKK